MSKKSAKATNAKKTTSVESTATKGAANPPSASRVAGNTGTPKKKSGNSSPGTKTPSKDRSRAQIATANAAAPVDAKARPLAPARGESPAVERDPRLPAAGTTLVKRDRVDRARCQCTVEAGGFRYRETLYPSLSAAASAAAVDLGIKGRVNGFVFWGLAKPSRPVRALAEGLRKIASRYEQQAATLLGETSPSEVRLDVRRDLEAHASRIGDLLAKTAA